MTEQDYTDFMLALKEIQSKIAKPDLMKVGKNFRCISESAILDVINPILIAYSIDYNIEVVEHDLKIIEADKFIFAATCKVRLTFTSAGEDIAYSEALGMGIDEGDKAMGKAYTYAVKYALLKKFRLQYADDPDARPAGRADPEYPFRAGRPDPEQRGGHLREHFRRSGHRPAGRRGLPAEHRAGQRDHLRQPAGRRGPGAGTESEMRHPLPERSAGDLPGNFLSHLHHLHPL